ncbi:sulfite exporter TauE/SafE family protein [Pseudomonas paraeruginosa]|uniref:sulfite exporter TauE/SafE family protein n=1 Tax=Pseudomonas aeruginosa group TaxID=136841 RepID=UPI00071BF20A|nr:MULTISPECIES: sulfite exporter TauE/SafE family protein [Pseudomonas aeruginosa group]KSF79234.1 anion permease [Pseudomonas aeruginosa]KSR46860.1 anion permease [Pseudomonas aeruginosa]PTC39312.1 putative membrane protein [Pseudomonas aeruginosa]RPV02934.1 sulfite exporter TauE/SafE family protein [Pseudomonas aeruginosa]
MSVDLHALIPLIALTFLLAGFVKGVVGLGLPTVSVGLLGLAMPPMQAAALLIVPSMVTNLWQLACGPSFLGLMKRLAGMLLGVVVGTLLVGAWLGGDAPRQATGVLGLALVVYALLGLAAIALHLPARHERWVGPLVGLATGALTAVTGVFVIPAVPYLGALGLQRDELVQALGLSFSASTLALAVTLGVHGDLLEPQMLGASLLTLVPALGGMLLGQWLRQRISAMLFRRCFFVGLLLLGADLAWRGFH